MPEQHSSIEDHDGKSKKTNARTSAIQDLLCFAKRLVQPMPVQQMPGISKKIRHRIRYYDLVCKPGGRSCRKRVPRQVHRHPCIPIYTKAACKYSSASKRGSASLPYRSLRCSFTGKLPAKQVVSRRYADMGGHFTTPLYLGLRSKFWQLYHSLPEFCSAATEYQNIQG